MKIWSSWASSHSLGVRVAGRFRSAETAEEAAHLLGALGLLGRAGHTPEAVAVPFRERGLELEMREALRLHHLLYSRMNGWDWPFGEVALSWDEGEIQVEYSLGGESDWCWEAYELSRVLGEILGNLGAREVTWNRDLTWRADEA